MAAIQRLRLRAQENGKLETTPQQTVTVQQQDNRRTVVIEQASDDTVYVPAYDPAVVYGAWPYSDYPPYYWGYPEGWGYGIAAGVLARGLWFGAGYALGSWGSGNWGWGGRVNWGNGNIIRNWPRATPYNVTNINNIGNRIGNTWQHNPAHRRGVRYSNANVQQRFGNGNRVANGNRGNLGGNRGNLALRRLFQDGSSRASRTEGAVLAASDELCVRLHRSRLAARSSKLLAESC